MTPAERIVAEHQRQERRYQLLQAAAAIMSGGCFTREEAVEHAEYILQQLERKDSPNVESTGE